MDYLFSKDVLDSSVNDARKGVLATCANPHHVAALGIALQKRFLATYSQKDLDDGIEKLQEALMNLPDDSHQIPAILNSSSILLQSRAAAEERPEDASVAVALAQAAVEICTNKSAELWYYQLQFCRARTLAHELDPNQNQTDAVLAKLDQLLVDSPDRLAMLLGRTAKAQALKALYKWNGDDGLVVDFTTSDLHLCQTDTAKVHVAQSCGECYSTLFDRGGSTVKLSIALGQFRLALQFLHKVHAPGAHPYEFLLHSLCGSAAQRMFQSTHTLGYIESAKNSFKLALQLMGTGNIFRTKTIIDFSLAVQLISTSQQQSKAKSARDLVVARRVLKAELQRSDIPKSERRKFTYLLQCNYRASAAYGLQTQEDRSADKNDSQELQLEFLTDPDALGVNINLLMDRIWGRNSYSDENYVVYKQLALRYEAVVMGPRPKNKTWNPSNNLYLSGLKVAAALLLKLFFSRQDKDLGHKAAGVCIKIAINPCFDAARRLWAATMVAIALFQCLDEIDERMISSIDLACTLMPQAIPIGLKRVDQLFLVRKLHYTPKLAASIYIAGNRPFATTISALEKGRSLIWDQLLARRAPFDDLLERDTDLATRWKDLQIRAGTAEASMSSLNILYDPLILQARQKDLYNDLEHRGFASPLSQDFDEIQLRSLAQNDVVVILNITELRSDAIVLDANGLNSIHLPEAGQERCKQEYDTLKSVLETLKNGSPSRTEWDASDKSIRKVLLWIWIAIAQPVLNCILTPMEKSSEGLRKRVWWVTSSWANLLPIHAAGDHERALSSGAPCSVIELTESSYIPTLRALREARNKMHELTSQHPAEPPTALLVAMRTTADRRSLPKTKTEIETVGKALEPHFFTTTNLFEPPTAEVLNHLKTCTIAHIASHGEINRLDPMKSHLLFRDYGKNPLSVQTLIETPLQRCQLVYLSACETTVNEDVDLLDEGIHISGGFQMAGVPNAISTWWTVFDDECVDVTKIFYEGLVGADGSFDVGRCAKSLRLALLRLIRAGKSPLVWAAYSHFGV